MQRMPLSAAFALQAIVIFHRNRACLKVNMPVVGGAARKHRWGGKRARRVACGAVTPGTLDGAL